MGRRGGSFGFGRRSSGGGGGGAGGAGLLSLFNFHSVVGCSADNTSMYCSLMKLVNAVGGILFLAMVAYIAYLFLAGGKKPFMGGGRRRRRRR